MNLIEMEVLDQNQAEKFACIFAFLYFPAFFFALHFRRPRLGSDGFVSFPASGHFVVLSPETEVLEYYFIFNLCFTVR